MALEKTQVPIPFAGGVNTKVDALQLNPPFLASAQNCQFNTVGRVQKRNGYASLSRQIAGTATEIDTGYALAQYRDELLAFDQNDAYSYAADANQWISKGAATSNVVTRTVVGVNTAAQDYQIDGVTHPSGLQCYVWTRDDEDGLNVWMTLLDTTSGQVIRQQSLIAENCWRPRVIARQNSFLIYVADYDNDKIMLATLGVGTPLASLSFVNITGGAADSNSLNSNNVFDVVLADSTTGGGNSVYLVFNNQDPSGGVSLWHFASGASTTATTKTSVSGNAGTTCTVFFDPFRSGPVIAWADNTTLFMATYTGDLNAQVTSDTVDALASIRAITGVSCSATSLDLRLFYCDATSTSPIYTASLTGDYELSVLGLTMGMVWNYALTAPTALLYGVKLASKAFARDGVPYVAVTHESDLQSTYFVVNGDTGNVVVRALRGTGVYLKRTVALPLSLPYNLPTVTALAGDAFRFAVGEVVGLPPDVALTQGITGSQISGETPVSVSALTIDFFDAAKGYQWAEIGADLHLGSGSMSIYDGQNFVEDGFHLSPEDLTVSGLSAGSTTSYSYVGVYEWTDNQNNLWRSSPSVPVVTTSSAAISGANDAAIVFPTLRITDKTPANGRGNVMLALYRTEDGGSVYYRLPYTSTNINDTSVNSVTITDATEDADLVDGIRLYTDGGVVENVPPPPVGAIVAHRNRLFVLDSTHPLTIAYSKEVEPGIPAEFGEGFNIYVSPNGGNVTALASMDDKLVIFKESRIFALTGEGPDPTGANDDYASPVFVTADCGCINPRSVVLTPDGLMFQSLKGIKLLTRALEVVDIGAPVSGLDAASVTSGVLMPDVDQVRFTFDDGTALMYDYFVKQWAQFTNVRAVDSVIWNALHVYLRSDGTSLKETPGTHTDNGSHIPMLVKTPWLKLAGLQGFQRLWRFLILGTYESPHDLLVSIAHNFNPTPSQVVTIEPTGPAAYGVDTPYGSGTPYGGEFPLYQWQVNMTRQTSQAVQITIQDTQSGSAGQGMTLSGITLQVGQKQGTNKLGTANIVGP